MSQFIHIKESSQKELEFNNPGNYTVFFHNISGVFSFVIKSSGVHLNIYGLLIGQNDDVFTIKTIQKHQAPASSSNLLIKGVFTGESKMRYQGLIRIEKEGQQSHAYQKNQNLILSPNTFVESKPFLEILANDVFCTHGSTTGKINEDSLYYLQTRGVPKKQAELLIVRGFMNDVIEKVEAFGVKLKDKIFNAYKFD